MKYDELVKTFWRDVAAQDAAALKTYFAADATVRWPNTNEEFTADEYITANCEYPGKWRGEVERIERAGDLVITVARVREADGGASVHATSFFELQDGKIWMLTEYWGEDGPAPQWRQDMHIGRAIE
jgi:ketosteroid isomerase-like protein